jgi:hypothetical protein
MNIFGLAFSVILKIILAVCAILSFFWPRKALRLIYRSRKMSTNPLRIRITQVFAGLAAIGLLWALISELLE